MPRSRLWFEESRLHFRRFTQGSNVEAGGGADFGFEAGLWHDSNIART